LFAQSEHDKWEQNKINGNKIKINGNKKRLKIKIQIQNPKSKSKIKIEIQNQARLQKKNRLSFFPCEAWIKNLLPLLFSLSSGLLSSHLLASLLSYAFIYPPSLPSPFHLGYFIRSYAFIPCVISHLASASPSISIS
jgi:hypothetical protein